jgi:HAD superfamily hydrolase (TIGR01509 family)
MLKYGVKISEEELHTYTGTTAKQMFTDLIRKYKINTTFDEIFAVKEELLFGLLEKHTEATKGIIELLYSLKSANIKLGIGSSSHKRLITYVLNRLRIADLFEAIVSGEDMVHSKPDPEIFLKAAEKLKAKPEECIVVEDSELGVQAAKKAGMKCIGYRNPNSGNQDLSKADLVIDDFTKLKVKELLSEY